MDENYNKYEKVHASLIIVGGSKGISIPPQILKAIDCDIGDELLVYIKKKVE